MCLTGVYYSHWVAYGLYPEKACVLVEETEYKHTYVSIIKVKKNGLYPERACVLVEAAEYKHTYVYN